MGYLKLQPREDLYVKTRDVLCYFDDGNVIIVLHVYLSVPRSDVCCCNYFTAVLMRES